MKSINFLFLTILLLLAVLFSVDKGLAQPQEATFNFTGGQQSFVVPPNVFSVNIQAWGAQGADATIVAFGSMNMGPGGLGGFAEGDLAVMPGQTLEIFVGGQGTAVDGNDFGGGGFNGGGDARGGGTGNQSIDVNERGGGGGASDVRVGGTTLNHRVIVAAGGGGAGTNANAPGGDGGGLTGDDGGVVGPGFGGTQTQGGAAQAGLKVSCLDGEFGIGGSARDDTEPPRCAGGGGGWYGGGAGTGAGGGSSYIDNVENGSTTPGVREGDGLVVLTFTPRTPIPTLSEWGLIAMAGVLGIIGFMVLRRRKATA